MRRSQILAVLVSGEAMTSFAKRLLEHGPRYAAARLRGLASAPLGEGHVLMLHTGRSGSTVLGQMLDQHSGVFWDGELLEKRFHRIARARGVGVNHLYGALDLADAVALIRRRMKALSGGRVFGLEVQDYHLEMLGTDAASLLGELRALGFTRFVILNRNPIRKLVSHIAATERGQHHVGVAERVKADKVSIDCDEIYAGHRFASVEEVLGQYSDFFAAFERLLEGEDVLRLSYTAHVEASPLVAYEAICGYLGLTPEEPAITLRKTTNRNLADVIENYAEFEARMVRSRFAADLEEIARGKA